jgi:hypothetical protein
MLTQMKRWRTVEESLCPSGQEEWVEAMSHSLFLPSLLNPPSNDLRYFENFPLLYDLLCQAPLKIILVWDCTEYID